MQTELKKKGLPWEKSKAFDGSCFVSEWVHKSNFKDLNKILESRTALVIAHRLATIEKSDRILVLKSGCLVEQGTHMTLRAKKGLYFQLSELQEKGFANF